MKKLISFLTLIVFISCTSVYGQYNITVAKDGSGNYTTVQAAFNAVPSNSSSRTVIYIKNGTYTEHLTVPSGKNNITVIGESRDGVILSYNLYANTINSATGATWGFDCASLIIRGSGFYATKITIRNNAGTAAQALAVNIQGDKTIFNDCRFLARQDTWYGGNVRVYSKNCYIEGTTDFIYGAATAFFEGCSLYTYGGTSITAASTESYRPYGLVFNNCNIAGASSSITDLGRPWRAYAAVCFMNTSMSNSIKAVGWNDWGNAANQTTARFREYNNSGAGAATSGRVSWMKFLTAAEAANYNYLNVLKNTYSSSPVTDNWNPVTTINATPTANTGSAFSTIQAENYASMAGIQTETCSEGGLDVSYIHNSDWIRFAGVNFGTGATGVSVRVASNTTGGTIKFRIDAAGGTQIGAVNIVNTGGWQNWTTVTGSVSGVSGVHDLYLSFSGGTGYLFNVNHFVFTGGSARLATTESLEAEVEYAMEGSVKLFPNPADNLLTIEVSEPLEKNAKMVIYDNVGRPVLDSKLRNSKTSVDVGSYSQGIYILKLSNGRNIITRKFLKK